MKDNQNFKATIDELAQINEWFQNDDIDLDEGLQKLKKGKELIILCKTKLSEIENEFIEIKKEIETEVQVSNNQETVVEQIEKEVIDMPF